MKTSMEDLFFQLNDVFARHGFDINIINDFKVKLLPIDERAAYSQNFPAPQHLKEAILVEKALLQKDGIITTLSFSKYATPSSNSENPTVNSDYLSI